MRPEEYKLPKDKFALVNENKRLHDKELVTKPIGFFKDAMHRFARNKGSIFGAIVIGILVLYALIAPIFSPYRVSYTDAYYVRTLPRLFSSETVDFLDGAKDQTSNVATFINHYSMGLETGHNAIKRQSYKYNPETGMYKYRLDSYESVGTVFMGSVAKTDYDKIQDYQDRTGVQIIYPITDVDLRPKSNVNKNNANFWYKTQSVDGNDVPVDYTIKDDGTVELSNIYKAYASPSLNSSSSNSAYAAKLNLETKGAGYAIKVTKIENDTSKKDVLVETYLGYLYAGIEDGNQELDFVQTAAEATEFDFDSAHGTFVFNLSGHENASLDGNYFFALDAVKNSTVFILPVSQLDDTNYIPFGVYKDGVKVSTLNTTDTYNFIANRVKESTKMFYGGGLVGTTFRVADSLTSASTLIAVSSGTGYKLKIAGNRTIFVGATANGDATQFSNIPSEDLATVWEYDSALNAFKTNITGHTTASLDGDYYITLVEGASQTANTIELIKGVDLTSKQLVLNVASKDGTPVTSIEDGQSYCLLRNKTIQDITSYKFDGNFDGDNYHSRMRIEGEDNYKYSYAYVKDGNRYEIRVNYHEYYKYYHKEVLKDKIRAPYFLFGTTSTGQDIFTCLASGARFSFLLAISVAAVNFFVGTIYGAIEGYYGGKIDMVMERIVEILSAVPFMIVITLLKYHMKGTSQALILFISFFLTGWIGMSGTVRMQFYRFKNQEYVLAARTLGAKDPRIMFKHIFPNSLGTIVTGSVLVIPGMIFSETSLSYLGIINLNSGDMTSVGTLLAAGQPYLVTYPHMILFPAIFISLLMLCFNLFGNGLRDAFNPSLRGTEE